MALNPGGLRQIGPPSAVVAFADNDPAILFKRADDREGGLLGFFKAVDLGLKATADHVHRP
jgi:hypothetical protein